MRVAFWGTPEFAAPALRALVGEGFEVVGVVTQPDKPQGRSREIIPSPVKQIAIEEEIPLFQPKNARDPDLFDKRCLQKWYTAEQLASDLARRTFCLPQGARPLRARQSPTSVSPSSAAMRSSTASSNSSLGRFNDVLKKDTC